MPQTKEQRAMTPAPQPTSLKSLKLEHEEHVNSTLKHCMKDLYEMIEDAQVNSDRQQRQP